MTTIIASAATAEHPFAPFAGLVDDIRREEERDDKRGFERDETDTELLDALFTAELTLLGILPTAEDRPPLPKRKPNATNPPNAPRPQGAPTGPALPHPQI